MIRYLIFIQESAAYDVGFIIGKLTSYLIIIGIIVGLIILIRKSMKKKN